MAKMDFKKTGEVILHEENGREQSFLCFFKEQEEAVNAILKEYGIEVFSSKEEVVFNQNYQIDYSSVKYKGKTVIQKKGELHLHIYLYRLKKIYE